MNNRNIGRSRDVLRGWAAVAALMLIGLSPEQALAQSAGEGNAPGATLKSGAPGSGAGSLAPAEAQQRSDVPRRRLALQSAEPAQPAQPVRPWWEAQSWQPAGLGQPPWAPSRAQRSETNWFLVLPGYALIGIGLAAAAVGGLVTLVAVTSECGDDPCPSNGKIALYGLATGLGGLAVAGGGLALVVAGSPESIAYHPSVGRSRYAGLPKLQLQLGLTSAGLSWAF